MDLRCLIKRGREVLVPAAFVACLGCSDAVKLIQDTETGGVVTYMFKEERGGAKFSSFRSQAFEVMEQKCPSGYTIVKEVETRGYQSVSVREPRTRSETGAGLFSFGVRPARFVLMCSHISRA